MRWLGCACLSCVLVLCAPLGAQTGVRCRDRDYTGFFDTPSEAGGMVVRDGIGFFAWGSRTVAILDLSDPSAPVVLSTFGISGGLGSLEPVGDRLYVCTQDEMRIFDISDLSHPAPLGAYPGRVWGVTVRGSRAYADIPFAQLTLLDVSDPMRPRLLLAWDPPESIVNPLWIGDYVYAARSSGGIDIFDVSDWMNPRRVGSLDTDGLGGDFDTDGRLAYIAADARVWVFDVSDVALPVLLSTTPLSQPGRMVRRESMLIVTGYESLQILDASDPFAPLHIGWYDVGRFPSGAAVTGDSALVGANNGGVHVIDISRPKLAPATVGIPEGAGATRAVLNDGLLCVARGLDGVCLVDLSDPWAPLALGSIDTPGTAADIARAGDLVCVADLLAGVQVIDVSDPGAPMLVGTFDSAGRAATVAASGRAAFVGAQASRTLEVVDLGTPSDPVRIATFDLPHRPLALLADGGLLYVADGQSGLLILDIADPSSPSFVGALDTPGLAYDVSVGDGLAVVADGDAGLHIIDVSDPAAPALLGSAPAEGLSVHAAALGAGVAVAIGEGSRLMVFDLRDPRAPRQVGWHDTVGQSDLAIVGDAAVVLGGSQAAIVVDVGDCPCPADFNGDGAADSRDVIVFLNAWAAGDDGADYDENGVINAEDFAAFLGAWMAGC